MYTRTDTDKHCCAVVWLQSQTFRPNPNPNPRHLSDDHALQLEELSNQSKRDCGTIKAQLEQMSKECELQSLAIATFTNIITEKEREINELKSKVRVTCILLCISIEHVHVSSIWLK